MAGGTGGHIFPGLAVADKLTSAGWKIDWLGTADRMEAQLVPKHGYDIHFIDIKGVRNKGFIRKLLTPLMVIKSVLQARKLMKENKPDLVLGFGGYAALPGGLAAKLMGVPLIIHEQNAAPGMTNKVLAPFANKVMTAFAGIKGLGKSNLVVGNPVRAEIKIDKQKKDKEANCINILVIGGSLGARILNQTLPSAVAKVLEKGIKVKLVHQVGKGNKESVASEYKNLVKNNECCQYEVSEFIDDMAQAYKQADIVICRAGALTVSELAVAEVASLLVPLPHAVDDHQTKNAQILVDAGAGILMPQNKFDADELANQLLMLMELPEQLNKMANCCRKVAIADASQRVADIANDIVKR